MNQLAQRLIILFLTLVIIVSGNGASWAQDNTITLIGQLVILSGDPPLDSPLGPQQNLLLQDADGENIARLIADASTVSQLRGQRVLVTGNTAARSDTQAVGTDNLPLINVLAIEPAGTMQAKQSFNEAMITGSHPWANILCKFSDINNEPFLAAQYQQLFSSTYPGLDHYWRQLSYNQVNISGTFVVSRWYTLPHPREYYIPEAGSADLQLLFTDCVEAANADVDYSQYDGINLLFNDELDCCAWGGWRNTTLDGQSKTWSVTWLPSWAHNYYTIAHEMGHGFGLLHSSGPSVNPPVGNGVYVSQWDVMSFSKGVCQVSDKDKIFGCLPAGTIAYQQEMLGWIPPSRVAVIEPGHIADLTLENIRQPASETSYLMAKIPINGSTTHFYTVEARFKVLGHENYDQNIPATTVLIHDVVLGRGGWPGTNTGPALVVIDTTEAYPPVTLVNGEEAIWKNGESFYDAASGIRVSVTGRDNNTFTVTIVNQSIEAPGLLTPENNTAATALPIFAWNAVNSAVSYEFQLDTRSDFLSGGVITAQTAATTYTLPGALASGMVYYWKVRAQSVNGTYSGWSDVASFTLESDSAESPMMTQYTTSTPTLTWGPVTWANGYKVEVSQTQTFDSISFTTTLENGRASSVLIDPLSHGVYYWRVCPRRSDNSFGTCSAADRFVINAQ